MTSEPAFDRIAVVVHPTRAIENALAALRRWTDGRGIELVQLASAAGRWPPSARSTHAISWSRRGDGTMLTALRASADAGAPVGVACGSLGALRGVSAERIAEALERFLAGDWIPRALPALAIETADGPANGP